MIIKFVKTLQNIPHRVIKASGYSLNGLKETLNNEESFRLEVMALVIIVGSLFFVPWPLWKKFTLLAVFILIPLAEIFNSALEDLCDLVSPEFNCHIKSAKDKGSAAVLLAIIINCLALGALIMA